ncbi:MAG: cytochrome-c oxidase, cbb3-type subunit III [Hyphomicrobiales bacterium]
MAERHIDELSGTETTGHEWDGLKELNTPLPRWWLYIFYITIVWAALYWIAYPTWPMVSSYTKGMMGYSAREEGLMAFEAGKAARAEAGAALENTALDQIQSTPALLEFAQGQGKAAFGDNCAPCHGLGATGGPGFPNLNDDDWLWGGTLDDIYTTLQYGIRSGHDDARDSGITGMTAFGADGILDDAQIATVVNYVRSLSGLETDPGLDMAAGQTVFVDNCAACHGEDAKGMLELGAPNLTDGIWLYGSSPEAMIKTVTFGRKGVMPAWSGRLDPVTVKSLAVYVHNLGGGK